jgi:hypothetical protein
MVDFQEIKILRGWAIDGQAATKGHLRHFHRVKPSGQFGRAWRLKIGLPDPAPQLAISDDIGTRHCIRRFPKHDISIKTRQDKFCAARPFRYPMMTKGRLVKICAPAAMRRPEKLIVIWLKDLVFAMGTIKGHDFEEKALDKDGRIIFDKNI